MSCVLTLFLNKYAIYNNNNNNKMGLVKFYKGAYEKYDSKTMTDGIYFATDKQIVIMDGKEYVGAVGDVTLNGTSIVDSSTKTAKIQVGSEDDTDTYSMVAPLKTSTETLYDEDGNEYENTTVVIPDKYLPSSQQRDTYSKLEIDNKLNAKQDTLVSGTNIKTLRNTSLLGSGDIDTFYVKTEIDELVSKLEEKSDAIKHFETVKYNSSDKKIYFYNGETELANIDCDDFIISGFVKDVTTDDSQFIFTFSTDTEDKEIKISFSKIFDSKDYYKADLVDEKLKTKQDVLTIDDTLSTVSTNLVENKAITNAINAKQDELVSETNIKSLKVSGETYSLLGEGSVTIPSAYSVKVLLYSSSNSYYSVTADFITSEDYQWTTISDFTSWLYNQGYNSSSKVYPCSGIAGKHTGSSIFSSFTSPYVAKWMYTSSNGTKLYAVKEDGGTDEISSNCNSISVIHTRII